MTAAEKQTRRASLDSTRCLGWTSDSIIPERARGEQWPNFVPLRHYAPGQAGKTSDLRATRIRAEGECSGPVIILAVPPVPPSLIVALLRARGLDALSPLEGTPRIEDIPGRAYPGPDGALYEHCHPFRAAPQDWAHAQQTIRSRGDSAGVLVLDRVYPCVGGADVALLVSDVNLFTLNWAAHTPRLALWLGAHLSVHTPVADYRRAHTAPSKDGGDSLASQLETVVRDISVRLAAES